MLWVLLILIVNRGILMFGTRSFSFHHRSVASALVVVLCGVLVVTPVTAAVADEPIDPSGIEVMGQFPAADFTSEARALPPELLASLDSDLGITGEQFLAQSEAAAQAVAVVDSLGDAGVDVLGSSIDGTILTVNIASQSQSPVVEAAGARAVVGEPAPFVVPDIPLTFSADPASDFYGGQGYYYESGPAAYRCTSGFNGFSSGGAQQFVSAGHCVSAAPGDIRALNMTGPNQTLTPTTLGSVLGTAVPNSARLGEGYDAGLVSIANTSVSPQASVLTWGFGAGAPLASTPVGISGMRAAIVGESVCKSGSTTGWACGSVLAVDFSADVQGAAINSIVVNACTVSGDSGGALVSGNWSLGVTSWATDAACSDPSFAAGAFPMVGGAGKASVSALYGSSWEIAAAVATPAVAYASPPTLTTTLSGTLAQASGPSKVSAYFDGSSTPVTVTASSGTWSVPLSGMTNGEHSYRVEGRYGANSVGASFSGTFFKNIAVDRLAGSNRYATSARVAQQFASADVVFVASGENYPDALSAAPVAARYGAPMLLTPPGALASETAGEIRRLSPSRIIIVGGTPSVSATVASQLEGLLPGTQVERQSGVDRYATSRAITRAAFIDATGASGASTVFLSTGANFPDALAASPAASTISAPVILVNGGATSLDAATVSLLRDLGATKVYLLGSAVTVSSGIENYISGTLRLAVQRLAGPDRYQTGIAINREMFTSATTAYLAVGTGYADALSGSALAGRDGAPLFISPTACVPAAVLTSLSALGVTRVRLLGSVAVLSANVESLGSC